MAHRSSSRLSANRPVSPLLAPQSKQTPVPNPLKSSLKPDSRPRHRPAQSYGGPSTISERIDKLLREIEDRQPDPPPNLGLLTQSNRQVGRGEETKSHLRTGSSKSGKTRVHARKLSLETFKPKSVVWKFGHRSEVGFIPGNPMKVNQDVYIEREELGPNTHLFSVCDGHGYNGHEVSGYLRVNLPLLLEKELKAKEPSDALAVAIGKADNFIRDGPVDARFSGSTLICTLLKGTSLYCANVGDSRALLARELRPGHWMCVALSRDHKPDCPEEWERIQEKGGRVLAYQSEDGKPSGPARVWLKDQNTPGLAMSRSIGDLVAKSVGVVSEPEIFALGLTPEDKFLVLGSDGVFEFMSNEDVVKLVVPYWKVGDVQGACDALYEAARTRWTQEEEVIDDITCVVVFLSITKGNQ